MSLPFSYELRIQRRGNAVSELLQERTKALALRVIHLVNSLPPNDTARVIGRQLLRSGTSVGANYRAALRAKSRADMLNKLKIVEEEADETAYWLELLLDAKVMPEKLIRPLLGEVNQIVAMTVASIKTMRQNAHS